MVLALRFRIPARVSIFGQHRPVLLFAWSAKQQYVAIASGGQPAATSSVVLGIRVNFLLTATITLSALAAGSLQ